MKKGKIHERKINVDGLQVVVAHQGGITQEQVDKILAETLPDIKRMMARAASKKSKKKKPKDDSLSSTLTQLGIVQNKKE